MEFVFAALVFSCLHTLVLSDYQGMMDSFVNNYVLENACKYAESSILYSWLFACCPAVNIFHKPL